MALSAGARLGPYEILAPLGAGGMGEVYKARDTRLDRTVAVKILPSADPELKQRFEREGKAIAALTHPHICTLYDVGHEGGTDYLVMEYLEGETLADRLQKGALPLDQVLKRAIEITDALDKAHRAGIVHRDLKPGNILLTKSGAKLLDFGLAKSTPVIARAGLSMLPTTPPNLTAPGTILGTLQYMGPEQLEGKNADTRTDIFAFGAVLFEMLTGKKAFEGANSASLIAAILTHKAPLASSLQPLAPPGLEHVLERCLAKDPDDRWQSIRDVMLELDSLKDAPPRSATVQPPRSASVKTWLGWAVAAGLLIAVAALALVRPAGNLKEPNAARLSILPPEHTTFLGGYSAPYLALSPDRRTLAFVPAPIGGRTLLWLRAINSLSASPLTGTDGATFPFWSPDGRLLAFFADGKLKTIDPGGGAPHAICDAPEARGGAWSPNGVIVFTPQLDGPLYRVPATGGQPVAVTTLDASRQEVSHRLPGFLPDGRHFLFLVQSGRPENGTAFVGSLDSTNVEPLGIRASKVAYAGGFVLFGRDQSLMAQAFDPSKRQLSGEPLRLADQVAVRDTVFGDFVFSVADGGMLAYWGGGQSLMRLTWYDRKGEQVATLGAPANYYSLALSPDETRVAIEDIDPLSKVGAIWMIDVTSGIRSRFTFNQGWDWAPQWSPDGARLVFGSLRNGPSSLYQKPATGNGAEELLLRDSEFIGPSDWSPDGKFIVITNLTRHKVGVFPLEGRQPPELLSQSESVEGEGRLSPDGRWLAYTSNESGTWDVYVEPFPKLGRKWRISPDGGSRPRWRRDGKELFYVAPDQQLMAVSVTTGSSFAVGTPTRLFQLRIVPLPPTQPRQQYAVTARGDRVLVNTVIESAAPSPITILVNWTAELKK